MGVSVSWTHPAAGARHPCERAKDVCAPVRVVARAHAHGEPGDGVVREGGVLRGRRLEDGGRDVEDASGAGAGAIVGSEAAPQPGKPLEAEGGHRVGLKGEPVRRVSGVSGVSRAASAGRRAARRELAGGEGAGSRARGVE